MAGGQAALSHKLRDRGIIAKMGIDESASAPQLPRRKSRADGSFASEPIAIAVYDVSMERKGNGLEEECRRCARLLKHGQNRDSASPCMTGSWVPSGVVRSFPTRRKPRWQASWSSVATGR